MEYMLNSVSDCYSNFQLLIIGFHLFTVKLADLNLSLVYSDVWGGSDDMKSLDCLIYHYYF